MPQDSQSVQTLIARETVQQWRGSCSLELLGTELCKHWIEATNIRTPNYAGRVAGPPTYSGQASIWRCRIGCGVVADDTESDPRRTLPPVRQNPTGSWKSFKPGNKGLYYSRASGRGGDPYDLTRG